MILHAHKNQGAAIEQLKKIVEIRLDGVPQLDVIKCDTRRHRILKYRHVAGRLVCAPDGNAARELLEGLVTIHLK